ncbi:unnamed protein product [Linum trigynum]|uniref:Gnk2-homologous domain-containing protein n=1 Tax=Linum trigynum TaxID=586398 RepID=A0AAV2DMI6_9ROSI
MAASSIAVLTILIGIMIAFDGANAEDAAPPLYVCNGNVDAGMTPCVSKMATTLITRDPRRGGRTNQCSVNATTTLHAVAYCYDIDYLPLCRLCLQHATKKVMSSCPDRVGARINNTLCAFRYEAYSFF